MAALLATLVLVACSDSGVVIEDGEPVGSAGEGPALTDPAGDGPTGALTPTSGRGNLDAADVAASRFLTQATFGPTGSSIAAFRRFASPSAWIDAQLAMPVSLTEPYTRANSNGSNTAPRHEAWWNNALDGDDQLRQRMSYALSQIFVISDLDYALANGQYGVANYYDTLSRHAFGNYRELLEAVTLHPAMGIYLSMVRNEKANPLENIRPDENYAREVLQLFSIGLYELDAGGRALPVDDPVPAYTQDTVEEFARVFTGWNHAGVSWETNNLGTEPYTRPMVPDERFHDSGAKRLLRGVVTPAGLGTRDDLEAALDNIFQHPNVGPFIGRQLIQRFVTSNPSAAYVERVASVFDDNGGGERGDLAATLRAVLLDEEARTGHLDNPDFGKLREPVIRWAHMWRALDGRPGPESDGVHNTADFVLPRMDEMSGQAVLQSPSVFNFYRPDHPVVAGGDTLSPEMQIMTEANLAATHNNYHHQVYRFNNRSDLTDDNPRVTIIDLEPLAVLARDPNALLDWYNLIFFAGNMSDGMREALFESLLTLDNDAEGHFARAQDSLFIVLVSPESHLQR